MFDLVIDPGSKKNRQGDKVGYFFKSPLYIRLRARSGDSTLDEEKGPRNSRLTLFLDATFGTGEVVVQSRKKPWPRFVIKIKSGLLILKTFGAEVPLDSRIDLNELRAWVEVESERGGSNTLKNTGEADVSVGSDGTAKLKALLGTENARQVDWRDKIGVLRWQISWSGGPSEYSIHFVDQSGADALGDYVRGLEIGGLDIHDEEWSVSASFRVALEDFIVESEVPTTSGSSSLLNAILLFNRLASVRLRKDLCGLMNRSNWGKWSSLSAATKQEVLTGPERRAR